METIDSKMKTLETEFNKSNDYSIMLYLDGDSLTVDEKKYLIDHCQERLNQMDMDLFLQTIRQTNLEFCEKCSHYLSNKIKSLTNPQIEDLLYINKYYHNVSMIANFLMKQDWFVAKKDKEYKNFFIAFKLEELLKTEVVEEQEIISLTIDIVSQLLLDSNPTLFDMIIKTYLSLLEKSPLKIKILDNFKRQGYKIIDKQIRENKELTSNMIIFDCAITKLEQASNVDYFEFYEKEDDNCFAYAHAGTVRINVAAIKDIYKQHQNKKIGVQRIFYVIGHEIDHVFCERYKKGDSKNLIEELRIFNSKISSALQSSLNRDFYLDYHDCFSHEFSATIKGIEALYHKQEYLPSITIEDKEEINKILAKILLYSYCQATDDYNNNNGYLGPVEFTRSEFNSIKEDLPRFAYHCLLNNQKDLPNELEEIENNLTEIEKFMLGYHNKYIGILELIYKDNIKSTDLFKDLPDLYEKYKDLIEGTYPPYIRKNKNK